MSNPADVLHIDWDAGLPGVSNRHRLVFKGKWMANLTTEEAEDWRETFGLNEQPPPPPPEWFCYWRGEDPIECTREDPHPECEHADLIDWA